MLCGDSARNRRRNPMLGEATGLRKVDPRKLVVVEIGRRGEKTERRRGRARRARLRRK